MQQRETIVEAQNGDGAYAYHFKSWVKGWAGSGFVKAVYDLRPRFVAGRNVGTPAQIEVEITHTYESGRMRSMHASLGMTESQGIVFAKNILPPELASLLAGDSTPAVDELVRVLQEARHFLEFNEDHDAPHMKRIAETLARYSPCDTPPGNAFEPNS